MRTIRTRQVETTAEKSHIYALRYDYYVIARELDVAADHTHRTFSDGRDIHALQYATYAGDDLVGCFRAEIGAPEDLSFGADWAFSDFVDDMPPKVALISRFCASPHLRDERVLAHMVRESVSVAKDFDLSHVFFETCPDLWPDFHAAGLVRKGGSLTDRQTGLQTAVFQLDCRPPARVLKTAGAWTSANDAGEELVPQEIMARPRLKIVMGGRR
jgi:hypothetical protein